MKSSFIYLNIFIFCILIISFPLIGGIISVVSYTPSGSGLDNYWIRPFVSLIPLSYLFVSIYFIFNKKYSMFIMFISMFIVFSLIFVKFYGKEKLINNYSVLFSKVGLVK